MQVILREDVTHLGEIGDLVAVKSGYARNYLLPRGLAVAANARQLARFQHEKQVIESRVAKARGDAEIRGEKVNKVVLTVEKAAGENDKLFGSVTAMEIEALLRERGFDIDRRKLQLEDTIKTLGEHTVGVRLHRDVICTIKVQVVRKADEA